MFLSYNCTSEVSDMNLEIFVMIVMMTVLTGGHGGESSCIKYEIFIIDFVAGKL